MRDAVFLLCHSKMLEAQRRKVNQQSAVSNKCLYLAKQAMLASIFHNVKDTNL
jgi:hypothetical protein